MNIEIENLKQEIRETTEKCTRCGMCNSSCPILRTTREEPNSPRGMMILLENNIFEKIIYNCTLCKACEEKCPLNLKISNTIINARKILANSKKELLQNKEMIKNIKETGNVFGKED